MKAYLRSLNFGKLFLAQTVSSFVESALLHSFDLMTTRLQVSGDYKPSSVRAEADRLYAKGGLRSFYRGFLFASLASIPGELTYRLTYDYNCRSAQRSPFLAGILASSVTSIISVPTDVISQRLQVSSRGVTALNVIRSLYKSEGIKGFYPTLKVVLLVHPIRDGIWWMIYEKTRNYSNNNILAASVVSSLAVAAVFNPIEVLKTKLQTGQSQLSAPALLLQMTKTPQGRMSLIGAGLLPSIARAAFDGYIHAFSYETSFEFAKG